ncbi:HipA family kinase [Halomonas hibernica]|uniref:HipA family kinase n=1 Tax=Halomonas hibernica TaxID=2591147 RepID=UPI0015554A2D|nr:HipA family kinase [Halomonas hibernica]
MRRVEIIEVIRRANQGVTRPYICRGDDDNIYFVKGKGASCRSLLCEWIAGKLALLLNVPIAPFVIVDVPEELLALQGGFDLSDLGSGPAFGSRECGVTELAYSRINEIPENLQKRVAAFDWWIHNEDRTLSFEGGNPNLFWDEVERKLVVIDHNQAFDTGFDATAFLAHHVFHQQFCLLQADPETQAMLRDMMLQALGSWHAIIQSVPDGWWYIDDEMTIPVGFDTEQTHQLLNRVADTNFWNSP